MRRFIIIGHKAATSGDFKLTTWRGAPEDWISCSDASPRSSYPTGSAGTRRCTRCCRRAQRTADNTHQWLRGPLPSNPDERSTGALVRNALLKHLDGEEMLLPWDIRLQALLQGGAGHLATHLPPGLPQGGRRGRARTGAGRGPYLHHLRPPGP